MKLSAILILSPLLSVALAAPKALPQSTDEKCVTDYCLPMSTAVSKCAEKSGITDASVDATTNKEYVSCVCEKGGDVRSLYDDCLGCFKDAGLKESYSGVLDKVCNGDYSDLPTTTNDDSTKETSTSEKKNAASSSKSSSLKMAGAMVIAGGIIAAM